MGSFASLLYQNKHTLLHTCVDWLLLQYGVVLKVASVWVRVAGVLPAVLVLVGVGAGAGPLVAAAPSRLSSWSSSAVPPTAA